MGKEGVAYIYIYIYVCVCVCVCVCAHTGILHSYKKGQIVLFAKAWVDLEIDIQSEEVRKRKTGIAY